MRAVIEHEFSVMKTRLKSDFFFLTLKDNPEESWIPSFRSQVILISQIFVSPPRKYLKSIEKKQE